MDWLKEKDYWPNSKESRFSLVQPHHWHIQDSSKNNKSLPTILLIHGAGASTHSWRYLYSELKKSFRVIAIDLPGHGFTTLGSRARSSLEKITFDIEALLRDQEIIPDIIVGHSAGAAVSLRLGLNKNPTVKGIVSINGALDNFPGLAGILYPFFAKVLSISPLTVPIFTRMNSSKQNVRRLLERTGSKIDEEGVGYYQQLISDSAHVSGTLSMMAQWDLNQLSNEWKYLKIPTCFLVGGKDQIVPKSVSYQVAKELQNSTVTETSSLGHLMHEEEPVLLAKQIINFYEKICEF